MTIMDTAVTEPSLTFRQGTVARAEGDRLAIENRVGRREVGLGSSLVADAVASLGDRPQGASGLSERLLNTGGPQALSQVAAVQVALRRFAEVGLIDCVALENGVEVARLTGEGILPVTTRRAPEVPLRMTRLAVVTAADGRACVQSGLSHVRVLLAPDLLPRLLSGVVLRHDPETGSWPLVVDFLWSAGLLVDAESDEGRGSRQWSACDLWFHQRTRESRGADRYGGTYPLRDDFPPEPFDAPPAEVLRTVSLPSVDTRRRRLSDPSLIQVMEDRRSVRDFDPQHAPTVEQVSELLFRTARARGTSTSQHGLEVADKPSPAGGSVHEVDVYLAVSRCDGLERGLWRYAPSTHALQLVTPAGPELDRMLDDARQTARTDDEPPVVVLLAARFGRLMWKYEAIPYALILKHAGVLYQSLYLVATALGLGICGLGGGSTGSFAAATGADPLLEGTVGELVLGIPAQGDRPS